MLSRQPQFNKHLVSRSCGEIRANFKTMSKEKLYWTTKNGSQIDIDEMSVEHLRNTLKMIVKQNQNIQKKCPHNINDAMAFSDEEVEALTNKSQYQFENEENLWK